MIFLNKGNIYVIVALSIAITTTLYGFSVNSENVKKALDKKNRTTISQIDINKNIIENKRSGGDVINSSNELVDIVNKDVELSENKFLEINIPKSLMLTDKDLMVSFDSSLVPDRLLSIETNSFHKKKESPFKQYTFQNGMKLVDSSTWNNTEKSDFLETQELLLKNGDIATLSDLINNEIGKLGKAGSFAIIDFGSKKPINQLNLSLTEYGEDNNAELIQLTFDNGIGYIYELPDLLQKGNSSTLLFQDTLTQFVKIDIISTKTAINVNNITNGVIVINNAIESDIIFSETLIDSNHGSYDFTINGLNDEVNLSYLNIYFSGDGNKPENSTLSLLPSNNTFSYTYEIIGGDKNVKTMWVELCVGIDMCLPEVKKILN